MEVEPLIVIPVFIHDFLCIHPFNDGNGRMSRLLTTLLLYRSGFYVGKYISLEAKIAKNKDLYYEALADSQVGWHEGKEDAIPFVKYIVNSLSKDSSNLQRQKEFMNAVKILINEKADSQKIAILPKLKYLADTNFDDNYELNVVDVVYGKESVEDLLNQYNAHKVSHRIQNSL